MKIKISALIMFMMLFFTLMTNVFAVEYVAKIGETKYETLSGAIEAAGSAQTTITVTNDINLSQKLAFPKGSNIILDLNNKNINAPNIQDNYGIVVSGDLIIKGKGTVTLGMYGIGVTATGSLVIEDGTYKCQTGDYLIGSWNKAVIKGGVFDGNYCIANGFNGGKVEILDGTFYSKEATIVLGKVEIFGGSFNQNVDDYLADGVEMKQYNGLYFTGKLYKVVVSDVKNGSIEIVAEAVEDQPVKITANPSKGYVLDNVKVTSVEGNLIAVANGEFVMPSSDVTVTATFELDGLDDTPQTGGTSDFIIVCMVVFSITFCFWIAANMIKEN